MTGSTVQMMKMGDLEEPVAKQSTPCMRCVDTDGEASGQRSELSEPVMKS